MKKKLEIDVTEIKSNLEKYLSKSVEYIKKDEKTDKGIKLLEKEKEINIYKYYNYSRNLIEPMSKKPIAQNI